MLESQFNAIVEWQSKTFPNATALSKLHHLQKETQELIAAVETKLFDKRGEYADCFFLLFGSAAADGMSFQDIVKAIDDKFLINQKRQWGKADANGAVEHIRSNDKLSAGDDDDYNEETDFQRCDACDGHDACEDFGCAIKAGIPIQPPL